MSRPTSATRTTANSATANPAARRQRWLRWAALAVVAVVPLTFAGLVIGAASDGADALESIPAAIVNNDTLITQTLPDGTEQPVFAGRQLVTELTSGDTVGFDWSITNSEDAAKALANGEVYAVLTVPSDFSKSILSISTEDPVAADISIRTDDSHSYLTGSVAQALGDGMVGAFGTEITEQFITGISSSIGEVGTSLASAADGAAQLADGATTLGSGLGELAGGATAAQGGANELTEGLRTYTGGVTGLRDGLSQLNTGAAPLTALSDGITGYSNGVAAISGQLSVATAALAADPTDAAALATVNALSAALAQAVAQAQPLALGLAQAVPGIQGGIAASANGAAQLAAGGPVLVSGASTLAGGIGSLAEGATGASTGAGELATGATELSDGLSTGAEQVPSFDEDQTAASAEVASNPVTLTVETDNAVTDLGQGIATFFVPVGLWIGALAVFLMLRPVTRRALASTANGGRLVFSTLARAGIVAGAQALLLVALLHVTLGVSWSALPATLGFGLLLAAAFTALHYLLTMAFGRFGFVVSLFLLAVQLTATGGIYPIEALAAPFQAISPFLPLTYGVAGMQAIISGGNAGAAILATVILLALTIGSVLISLAVMRRTRRAASLGLVPIAA